MDEAGIENGDRVYLGNRIVNYLSVTVFVLLAFVLIANFADWFFDAVFTVRYPYQIDYAEGVVWQQALMIMRGEGYADITRLPYVVFHYPPIFHFVTGFTTDLLSLDYLTAGRLVSLLSTLGTSVVIILLIARSERADEGLAAKLLVAFGAGLVMFLFNPVATWSPLMRVDTTATLLSFLGVYFGLRSPERPRYIYLCAVFFSLALYTKQTSIAAPMATLTVLFVIRPKLAGRGFLWAAGLGLAGLISLQLVTDGGFLKHILFYNFNRFYLGRFEIITNTFIHHISYFLIVISFLLGFYFELGGREAGLNWIENLRQRISTDQHMRLRCFTFIFILLTTVSLIAVLKRGANTNYFLELMFGWSLAIGLMMRQPIKSVLSMLASRQSIKHVHDMGGLCGPYLRFNVPIVFMAILFQALVLPPPGSKGLIDQLANPEKQETLLQRVRDATKPVISDDMVAVLKSGKEVVWESAIFNELAALDRWDEGPFIRMIEAQAFAFFVTKGRKGSPIFDNRYSTSVLNAMESAYPRKQELAGYTLHLPAD